ELHHSSASYRCHCFPFFASCLYTRAYFNADHAIASRNGSSFPSKSSSRSSTSSFITDSGLLSLIHQLTAVNAVRIPTLTPRPYSRRFSNASHRRHTQPPSSSSFVWIESKPNPQTGQMKSSTIRRSRCSVPWYLLGIVYASHPSTASIWHSETCQYQ